MPNTDKPAERTPQTDEADATTSDTIRKSEKKKPDSTPEENITTADVPGEV